MQKLLATQVFTPSLPATHTFVDRDTINEKLVDALTTPGKQLVVFGHTGSGKTTLINNKLEQTYENHIVSRCTKDMSFSQLLLNAFDHLGGFYLSETSKTFNKQISATVKTSYSIISGQINTELSNSNNDKYYRLVPPQLTPQKLATFFGELNACWVIEDFHKLDYNHKQNLSQIMKVFMDEAVNFPEVKIIAIGAVGTASEIVELDPEMQNRVAEIHVPLMNRNEIIKIIEKGESLLNIKIEQDVKDKIAKFSNGLASVAHQLCLNLCTRNNIIETCNALTSLDMEDFQDALEKYLDENSEALRKQFEKVTYTANQSDVSYNSQILKSFVSLNKYSLTKDEIIKFFKKNIITYSFETIERKLEELVDEKESNILKYDKVTNSYSFNNPFFRVFCSGYFDTENYKFNSQLTIFSSGRKPNKRDEKERKREMIRQILSGKIIIDF